MRYYKLNRYFLNVMILLFMGFFLISCSGLDRENNSLMESNYLIIEDMQQEYFSKINLDGFNFNEIPKTKIFYSDLIHINELDYGENLVVARVDGWDVTLNEIITLLAVQEAIIEKDIVINKQTYELYLDQIIKTKLYYSFALDENLLPKKTEIYEFINEEKERWNNETPDQFSALMNEGYYWDNYISYVYFGTKVQINIFNYIAQKESFEPYSKDVLDYFDKQIQEQREKSKIDILIQLKIPL